MYDSPGFFSSMFAPSSLAFQLNTDTLWYHFPVHRISLHPFCFQQPLANMNTNILPDSYWRGDSVLEGITWRCPHIKYAHPRTNSWYNCTHKHIVYRHAQTVSHTHNLWHIYTRKPAHRRRHRRIDALTHKHSCSEELHMAPFQIETLWLLCFHLRISSMDTSCSGLTTSQFKQLFLFNLN